MRAIDVPATPPVGFPFVGDVLCLDFLNTVAAGRDLLTGFASYVRWLTEAGVLSTQEAAVAVERWGPGRGTTAALAEVKSLRNTLRAAVHAVAGGERVPPATLTVLNPLLARAPACAELVSDAAGRIHKRFRLQWRDPADLLAPVVESAADLLAGADYSLIRQCAGAGCTLFFYDRTKNHRRRWCSVAGCGNRAKVAAYRARRSKAAWRKGLQGK